MGEESELREVKRSPWVVPSLILSVFSTYPNSVVSILLLVEIGLTFDQPVGVMAQMRTLGSLVGFLSAIAMGALSVRFSPKTLLLAGLLFLGLSSLGSGLAPNVGALFALYALTGIGVSMVEPMVSTLVAENYPPGERSKVLGWMGAGGGLTFIVGGSVVGYIGLTWGWRAAFLGYAMILPLVGLVISSRGIPSHHRRSRTGQVGLLTGFRAIASDRSALACLLGNMLASAMGQGIYVFSLSYLKEGLLLSPGLASTIFSASSAFFLLGSLACGWVVGRLGRKRATVSSILGFTAFTVLYPILPSAWGAVASVMLGHLFAAVQYSASASLSLEQLPGVRGSMMSMHSASSFLGYALGTGAGGFVLLYSGWGTLGAVLGGLGLVATAIYMVLARDPATGDT
ncbi:MAG: MFS transporter [Candidatus Bathyarchaeia archaeon]